MTAKRTLARAKRGAELATVVARHRRVEPPIRFVVLTPGRSGSKAMYQQLGSHPEVTCDWELLREPVERPMRHLLVHRTAAAGSRAWGFFVHPDHLTRHGILDAPAWVGQLHDQGVRPITLVRANPVARALSGLVASTSRNWHAYADGAEGAVRTAVTIDTRKLLREVAGAERARAAVQAMVEDRSHLHLVYERDLASPEAQADALEQVLDYLGLPAHPLETSIVRRSTPYSELISNWDEVVDFLAPTRWAADLARL